MKTLATFFLLIALAVAAFAQDAHVIQLSEKDATEAQRLYKQMVDSREAYAKFTGDITTRYTMDAKGHPTRQEWTSGWRFDQTFKFIVPGLGAGVWSVGGSGTAVSISPCSCWPCATTYTPYTTTEARPPFTSGTNIFTTTEARPWISSGTAGTITLEGKRQ